MSHSHPSCIQILTSGLTNQLHGLCNPEVQCRIHKGSPIIPILSRINTIPRIDTYLFKVHSNIVLPPTVCLGLPKGLFPVGLPTFLHSGYMTCPSQSSSDYIRWTVQTMKFLIVKPYPLPFASLLGPNIHLRILFSNTLSLRPSLNVRAYSTTGKYYCFIYFNFQILRLKTKVFGLNNNMNFLL